MFGRYFSTFKSWVKGQILPVLSASGGLCPPDQGLCPWTPLGAPPQTPYRLALRARHVPPTSATSDPSVFVVSISCTVNYRAVSQARCAKMWPIATYVACSVSCVCLLDTTRSRAKTAEPIETLFGGVDSSGLMEY